MGSKSVASIIIAIFCLNIIFSASLSSAQVPTTSTSNHCPDLRICVNVLKDLVSVIIGAPQCKPCCPLIAGLIDVEAHACICTAVKGQILGIDINIPIKVLLNVCGRKVPAGPVC
ncbi:lipid transfer protein EARLI 1-like [Vicia villosa]|uniref:lipid transfer protein EARLI 1-like n=1 Tax=Vicia villosa TaxID=3911 RepID=UPI00273ACBE8|nr:lipid transfer protein EARLI 1-like [Vicia villosa]